MLSLTVDNASNNDVMVSELEMLIPEFSAVNHTRCFLHVNNLVGRTLVKQFDVAKKGTGSDDEDDTALIDLAGDMDFEDKTTRDRLLEEAGEEELSLDDDVREWIDERAALSQAERDTLDKATRPVKMVLVKVRTFCYLVPTHHGSPTSNQVRKLAFKIVNSTTLLLPAWKNCVAKANLSERVIPRDVTTRWNSTYDMLSFVLEYRVAVDSFTAKRENDSRELELNDEEWEVVKQLSEVLMVRGCTNRGRLNKHLLVNVYSN